MVFRHARPTDVTVLTPDAGTRGESLVEVLVTLVLMGVGFIGIFGGILTVSKVTTLNLRQTSASNGTQVWAEGFQQPANELASAANPTGVPNYRPCATPAAYGRTQLLPGTLPSGWRNTQAPAKVELLSGYTAGVPQFGTSVSDCYANGDLGIQRITIEIVSPDEPKVVDTSVIIKRDQTCPATFDNADLGPC